MDSVEQILQNFEQISSVPRGTKREEKISLWLQDWAREHGFSCRVDQTGNLAIYVPGSPGFEKAPTVILQGHMDMVCEKTPDSDHDFTKDPIHLVRNGDWLQADRTTLGADNGIAIAIALVLVENASHPPLELLFTVEEEIGLVGASALNPSLVTGKILINLDSEEDGEFIVGCAGGKTTFITLPVHERPLVIDHQLFRLSVSGLQGGHSGADIHKHRANASKILVRALERVSRHTDLQLISLKGGTARNVIGRDAEVTFACPKADTAAWHEQLSLFETAARAEYSGTDSGLNMTLTSLSSNENLLAVPTDDTCKIIQILMALPHGVIYMSSSIPGFVETSTNLAVIELRDGALHIITNQRSTSMSRLDEITQRVDAIARLAGAQVNHTEGYPSWQPNMDSPLLERSVKVYEDLFGHKPDVKMIHAGLECGIIGDRCGGLDMISLGPTIKGAHSPEEKLYIPSVERVWQLLEGLLHTFSDWETRVV